jgi:hypothetical protein
MWLFALISGAVVRWYERKPAGGLSLPRAQVLGLAGVAAAAQEIAWQGRPPRPMVLLSEALTRAESLKRSFF